MSAIAESVEEPEKPWPRKYPLRLLLWILTIYSSIGLQAAEPEISVQKEGKYETRYQLRAINCADKANEVADYLINDFKTNTAHLFEWALKDLGLQDNNNEVIIVFKSSTFDESTNTMSGLFDIKVPGIKTFHNVRVDAVVTKTVYTSGVIKATTNIVYSSLLLKSATGSILFVPQKNNDLILISEAKMDFGWFFNLFITRNRYKSIVEWRIIRMTENVRDECLKRKKS